MNILYINHYAGSLDMGMEFRPFYFAREWKKMGHNVRIVAADFSHLRQNNPTVKNDFEIHNIDGIEFQFIKTGKYKGNGIKRAFTMFRFVFKLKLKAKYFATEFKPDAIITSSTYPLDGYAGDKIRSECKKNGKKCKWIHEEHDIWPLTLIELKGMKAYHPFVVLLQKAANFAYTNADGLVSLFPNAIENMKEHGLKDVSKFCHISNGIVKEDWDSSETLPCDLQMFIDKQKQERKFLISFLGGHALSNHLDLLIKAADAIKSNDNIVFLLVGNGSEKSNYIKLANDLNATNVHFFDGINKLQVPTLLKQMDALIIVGKQSKIGKFGCSINKIYDYMMSEKPIIYGCDFFYNNDVKDANCGISVKPDSVDSLVDGINTVYNMNIGERNVLGSNGKRWVLKNASYDVLSRKFIGVLES